jgi:hypothetical protein
MIAATSRELLWCEKQISAVSFTTTTRRYQFAFLFPSAPEIEFRPPPPSHLSGSTAGGDDYYGYDSDVQGSQARQNGRD